MRLFKMFTMRWKSSVRQPWVWAFVVLAVLCAMIPASSARFKSDTKLSIGLVNEDNGSSSFDLEKYMDSYDKLTVFHSDREKALRNLAMGRLEAVYVIEKGFTYNVQNDIYKGIITMYTAPATSAAVMLSETIVNNALMIWMVETALYKVDGYVKSEGLPFTPEQRQEMREEFTRLLHQGSAITIREHIPQPARTSGSYDALLSSMGWYATFIALFVIMGSGWVIESRGQALGERMRAAGIHPASALAGSSLAVIALGTLGWLAAALLSALVAGYPVTLGLRLLPAFLLYMAGLMGVTFLFSSVFARTMQLMLVAPVFTVTQGVLCGMLFDLPGWASLLYAVSYIFPGRLFMLASDALLRGGSLVWLLELAGISIVWLAVGSLTVLGRSRRSLLKAA